MKTHRRATATSAVVLILVFVSGALVGGAVNSRTGGVSSLSAEPSAETEAASRRQPRPPMYEQVGISDAQRVSIDSIVVDTRNRYREQRARYEVQYLALRDSAREAIKGVMTEDQRDRYDSLLQASDDRRAARQAAREAERNREDDEDSRREE